MSNKSKKLNSAFDGRIVMEAAKIADKYQIIISSEDGMYFGKGLEMPFVFGEGKTADECLDNTKEALTASVAHMIEQGQPIPVPALEGKRTEQINIRLTCEEKAILKEISRSRGYRGLGDFIRASALSSVNLKSI